MSFEYPNLEPIQCAGKEIRDRSVKPFFHPYIFPKILLSNVRSLISKLEEVKLCLENELVDIACICESCSATEDVVAFEGYDTYFTPRMTPNDIAVTHGGGFGIICRSSIRNRVLTFSNIPNKHGFEVLWLWPKKLPKEVASLVISVVYYPPRGPYRKDLVNYLQNCTDNVRSLYPNACITMCGDFNDLDAKWLSNLLSLKQVVNVPTRGNRMLDLIFSNCPEYYNTPVTLPPLGLSDHLCVAWTPNHFIPNRQINSVVYRIFTPELVNLYKKWLTDRAWRDILSLSDGDKMASLFSKELFEKYCEIFPQKNIYVKSNDKPWITQEIRNLIKVRNELHLTGPLKDCKRVINLIVYKIRCSRKQYGSKIISKIYKSNPRKFHDLVQDIIGKKVTRVEVRDVNGKPLLPSEINDFFVSICKIHPQL